MNRSLCATSVVLASLVAALGARIAAAQDVRDWNANRVQVTRAALEDLLRRLDDAARSSAYSGAIRDHARLEAAMVRARLAEGDFRVGDRFYLRVEGEPQLSDTFTVGPGQVVTLPIVGDVPLTGVLHAELESRLGAAILQNVRDPVVHARSLIRVAILGEVNRPGFYTVPTQTLVTDLLMLAGGPTQLAKLEKLRIERDAQRVWEGQALQQAMAAGQTLDQLSLQAGDRIEVPGKGTWFTANSLRAVTLLLSIPVAIYGIRRLFP